MQQQEICWPGDGTTAVRDADERRNATTASAAFPTIILMMWMSFDSVPKVHNHQK